MSDVDTQPIHEPWEVIVLGATPGGVAAAIAAARLGHRVLLIEPSAHVGGMSTSGLGKSDVEKRHLIGGLFREFTDRVYHRYQDAYEPGSVDLQRCQQGYYFEPSVAEAVLLEMIVESEQITLRTNHRLQQTEVVENQLRRIEVLSNSGESEWLAADVFVDATYEGDLFAAAGAKFRSGRESRDEFGEPHAGQIYFDYQTGRILPGSTGAADDRIPAYTYRLCLTTDPHNARRLTEPPDNYDRKDFVGYFDDLAAGRLAGPKVLKPGRGYHSDHFDTMVRALSVTELSNAKTDVNINPRPLAFPFAEENVGYLSGDHTDRRRIRERHCQLCLGLLWFLQNDAEIPAAHRQIALQYHLPLDEFVDNDHFPWQLYIREGRRLIGEYTLTELDMTTAIGGHADTITVGEFPIDSFPCRKRQPGDSLVLEGYLGMLDSITRPYEIPYRVMIPADLDGLIVPVGASTTHVAYSSIRMEPTWMALGQAAGTAAHYAITEKVSLRSVPIRQLRTQLEHDGQVLGLEPAD